MRCAEWDEIVKNTCIHDGYVLKNAIIFASMYIVLYSIELELSACVYLVLSTLV